MSSSERSRKRKRQGDVDREKLKQYGVDLPDLPGIPIQIIPLHIHAIKATTKFFQREASESIVFPYETTMQTQQEKPDTHKNVESTCVPAVMASVFDRMDETVSKVNASTDESRTKAELLSRKTDAINTWLEAIHRSVRDQSDHGKKLDDKYDSNISTKSLARQSVPVAVLAHLLDLVMEHKKVAVRRAATNAIGFLLHKSSDCRRFLLDGDENGGPASNEKLINWMNVTIEAEKLLAVGDDSIDKCICLLQRETYLLLQHLEQVGYGDLYPTLPVAVQRFQQFCPDAVDSDSSGLDLTQRTESYRREVRDIAMEYFETEEKRVHKLIDRAYSCVDVLVPRIGAPTENRTPILQAKSNEDEDDDDNIDWEEGWENNVDDAKTSGSVSHTDAVEQTMAVMKSTGGLRNGALEIDFGIKTNSTLVQLGNNANVPDDVIAVAKQRLQTVVQILSSKHMPRLSEWVDSLAKADGLVDITNCGIMSLVTMPTSQGQRRAEAFKRLSNVKRSVATLLQTTRRLRLELDSEASKMEHDTVTRRRPSDSLLAAGNHKSMLKSKLIKKSGTSTPKDLKRLSSKIIQIKYRKS